jgi:hypothetical protein
MWEVLMSELSRRRFLQGAASAAAIGGAVPSHDAMDDALELLASTGPEYHGGLANHGPMAAEALVNLGRPKAVVPWVEGYRTRLDSHPSGTRRISESDWTEALGETKRVGDWIVFFRRRVEERPWRDALSEWVPRLSPGLIAAAFHGVIRTAHAARSLALKETPARRAELAEGLAYWAANYHTLPAATHAAPAGVTPSKALANVAIVPRAERIGSGNIDARLGPVERLPEFLGVADLADPSGDASTFLSDLTATFAGVFLASVPPGSLITFVHSVTGPSAVRLLFPHLDAPAKQAALRYAWQGAAAFYSGFGGLAPRERSDGPLPAREDLIDRAIATSDEHAIKFTEACLREHAVSPNAAYLLAARHAIGLFG